MIALSHWDGWSKDTLSVGRLIIIAGTFFITLLIPLSVSGNLTHEPLSWPPYETLAQDWDNIGSTSPVCEEGRIPWCSGYAGCLKSRRLQIHIQVQINNMFFPAQLWRFNIGGSLNFEFCVWRAASSDLSHHPQDVLLAQFRLHKLKGYPDEIARLRHRDLHFLM